MSTGPPKAATAMEGPAEAEGPTAAKGPTDTQEGPASGDSKKRKGKGRARQSNAKRQRYRSNMQAPKWDARLIKKVYTSGKTHTFTDFDINAVPSQKKKAKKAQVTEWTGEDWKIGVDKNGTPIVAHLPNFVRDGELRDLTELVRAYGEGPAPLTKGKGADKKARDLATVYDDTHPDQIAGVVHLSSSWHPIGHEHQSSVISSGMVKTSKAFAGVTDYLDQTQDLSHRINATFKALDPKVYDIVKQLKEKRNKLPHCRALSTIDPLVIDGRAIMYNRATPPHRDSRDPLGGWEFLLALGDFTSGGDFIILDLNLKISFLPGTGIWLRGGALEHAVEAWQGGQRISIAHFTHKSWYREVGLAVP